MLTAMPTRRALLFMPGDDRHKIETGAAMNVDSIIMDLEDGVAFNRKHAARETISAALREVDFGRTERLVRLNPVNTGLYTEDLNATIEAHPDGYVLPKVEFHEHIAEISSLLRKAETRHGWPENSIALLAIVETARGIVNLSDIAASDPRLDALIFGAEDLAGDLGAKRTPDGWEVFYARSAVVIHAKAYGLQAIDTVHVDLRDLDSLVAHTEQALYMGYTGKLAIHPRQVDPIQRIFTPSEEEIQQAKRLIDTHHTHQQQGTGAFQMDGKMVDMPIVRAAEAVLARARAAGIQVD
jgi:citrate lyase beta subunit